MPAILREECRNRLPEDLLQVVLEFDEVLRRIDGGMQKIENVLEVYKYPYDSKQFITISSIWK